MTTKKIISFIPGVPKKSFKILLLGHLIIIFNSFDSGKGNFNLEILVSIFLFILMLWLFISEKCDFFLF